MERVERRVAVVGGGAVHAVAHIAVLVRSDIAWVVVGVVLKRLSPEEEVVHKFRAAVVGVEQRRVDNRRRDAAVGVVFYARRVERVRLVVTGLHLFVVGDVATLADTQICDAGVVAGDGIRAARILIVAVGIVG